MKRKSTLIFILVLFICSRSFAQAMHDSLYYTTFPNALTVRLYSLKDFANFSLVSSNGNSKMQYRSNTTVNLGAGITYKNVSGNLSFGFGFLNNKTEEKGKTSTIDFQLHFFPSKWTSDVLFLRYKGFYANRELQPHIAGNNIYYRPDISLNLLGGSLYRIQNGSRFSYRTAFYQNEWLRKSSGSFLYGGAAYYQGISSDDSSLLIQKTTGAALPGLNNFHFITIGPGAGYAQSLVFKHHFYIIGSAIINANVVFATNETTTGKDRRTGIEPSLNFKTAAGYAGNRWNVSLSWAGNVLMAKQPFAEKANVFPTSEVRLTVARHIMLKKPIPVVSNVIEKIFGKGY